MSAGDPDTSVHPVDQAGTLEHLLVTFDLDWHEGAFSEQAGRLPADDPQRRAALIEMAKIDLERRVRRGQHRTATDYLLQFPELADQGRPPIELLRAEEEIRREFGSTAEAQTDST